MSGLSRLNAKLKRFAQIFNKIKFDKKAYRYSLCNVFAELDESITLSVLVTGIKKQTLIFKPEEIVYDDELLSEFSPCDVRAITYLSFQKYINYENISLRIEGQFVNKGVTTFNIFDKLTNNKTIIEAKALYQNYDYLTRLNKKDMICAISTAVQEQTILDIKKMGGL